jgi:molecular chaperone DnaJ
MAKRDYYEVLGVSKTASDAELKSAFRKKAMDCHPDRHPGDAEAEARFKELNEAYQVLSDGQKRAAYDRMGHAAFEHGGGPGGFGGGQGFGSMSDIFEDLFGDVFGGGRRSGGAQGESARLRLSRWRLGQRSGSLRPGVWPTSPGREAMGWCLCRQLGSLECSGALDVIVLRPGCCGGALPRGPRLDQS